MPLSDEDKAEVRALLGESLPELFKGEDFSKAIGASIGPALDARLSKAVKGLDIDGKLSGLREELEAAKAAKGEPSDGGDGGGDGKGGKRNLPPEVATQIKALEDQAKQREAEHRELKVQLQRERDEKRAAALDGTLRETLAGANLTPARARAVAAMLKEEGIAKVAEDGTPVFRTETSLGDETWVSLKEGVQGWLKSDDAREFLPGAKGGGTGDRGHGQPDRSGGGATEIKSLDDLSKTLGF